MVAKKSEGVTGWFSQKSEQILRSRGGKAHPNHAKTSIFFGSVGISSTGRQLKSSPLLTKKVIPFIGDTHMRSGFPRFSHGAKFSCFWASDMPRCAQLLKSWKSQIHMGFSNKWYDFGGELFGRDFWCSFGARFEAR